jgi:hypothetical protein
MNTGCLLKYNYNYYINSVFIKKNRSTLSTCSPKTSKHYRKSIVATIYCLEEPLIVEVRDDLLVFDLP